MGINWFWISVFTIDVSISVWIFIALLHQCSWCEKTIRQKRIMLRRALSVARYIRNC